MHPEFKGKFVLAVAARAAQHMRVKMYEGVPDLTDFKEMQALMREAQVFWDDDAEKCGRVTAKRAGDKQSGANGGGDGKTRPCRCCGSKDHKTLTCPNKKVICNNFAKTGTCSFGDDCMLLHQTESAGER